MDYFYEPFEEGLKRRKSIEIFIYRKRKIFIHQGVKESFRVNDLETGLFLCEAKSIIEAKKESKEIMRLALKNKFDFERYPKINHPKVIEMFDLIIDLKNDYNAIRGTNNNEFKITF